MKIKTCKICKINYNGKEVSKFFFSTCEIFLSIYNIQSTPYIVTSCLITSYKIPLYKHTIFWPNVLTNILEKPPL
jgi:hypothetical protein